MAVGDTQSCITMMRRHIHTPASTHMLLEQKVCHYSVTLTVLQVLQAREPLRDYLRATALATHRHRHTDANFVPLVLLAKRLQYSTCLFLNKYFTFSRHISFVSFLLLCSHLFFFSSSLYLTIILALGCPVAPHLTHFPSISPVHLCLPPSEPFTIYLFLYIFCILPSLSCFFPLLPPPPCCTAVQRQISVLVPVRQRHGKLHAKTQSANADKGGGVRTSVHTKHQTHLNHKMK